MDSSIWGPHAWFFLHSISFNYPEIPTEMDKRNMLAFSINIGELLPCEYCKMHFKEYFAKNPIQKHLSSKTTVIHWFINLHNSVNRRLTKPEMDFNQVIKLYKKKYQKQSKIVTTWKCLTYFNYFIVFIAVIILLIYLVKHSDTLLIKYYK
jgi:hypothetical protein